MRIPTDPHMLLSYINTKLRDEFYSIDELCSSLDIEESHLITILSTIDYSYNKDLNRFSASI